MCILKLHFWDTLLVEHLSMNQLINLNKLENKMRINNSVSKSHNYCLKFQEKQIYTCKSYLKFELRNFVKKKTKKKQLFTYCFTMYMMQVLKILKKKATKFINKSVILKHVSFLSHRMYEINVMI